MLTQLSTIKSRLNILDTDTQFDLLLTNAIQAVSERFDRECNRTLARTQNFAEEFSPDQAELCLACYPLESVARFELKQNETEGWIEQLGVDYLIRRGCVLSLSAPLSATASPGSAFASARPPVARVIYTGGYVLPGTDPGPGQTPLPPILEQAAVEQVAFWFSNRERLGLSRIWEYHGVYRQFTDLDLLASVKAALFPYHRWQW